MLTSSESQILTDTKRAETHLETSLKLLSDSGSANDIFLLNFSALPNYHTLIIGKSGKGKSIFTELARQEAKAKGHLLVDTALFREGKGLKPYEHEYARRVIHGLIGRLPRALRGKPVTLISDVSRPKKRKWKPKHMVTTTNGIILDRELVRDASDQLQSLSGIRLNQPQLIKLMEESGIDETLADYGVAETQILESLADALSMTLIGRSWPSYKADSGFVEALNVAAKAAGYEVRF